MAHECKNNDDSGGGSHEIDMGQFVRNTQHIPDYFDNSMLLLWLRFSEKDKFYGKESLKFDLFDNDPPRLIPIQI